MKIIVVSDDELFRRMLRSRLEKWGHTVVIARTGLAAYKRIKKEMFRVVIMGWDLPGLPGPELCKCVRALERNRYIYVIVYTNLTEKQTMTEALEAGADDYITRPFNSTELRLRLKSGKRLLNLEDQLREGPGTDHDTGLVNKASFQQFFRVTIEECRRTESPRTLMFITILNFDDVYQNFGYAPARHMMNEIAKILRKSTRKSDLLAKVASNAFCMMLQNTFWNKCEVVSQKILKHLDNMTVVVADDEIRPQVSVSSLNYPVPELSAEEIFSQVGRTPVPL